MIEVCVFLFSLNFNFNLFSAVEGKKKKKKCTGGHDEFSEENDFNRIAFCESNTS